MVDDHEPTEPESLDELEDQYIGDVDNDLSLDNLKQIEENGDIGEVHQLQSRVKTRIKQLLDELGKDDREEAWRLIHGLRNLAIAQCNIEDQDPHRNMERLIEWAEEVTDEDGNLPDDMQKEPISEQEGRLVQIARDSDSIPDDEAREQLGLDDNTDLSVESYTELEEKHLEDNGRADLDDFYKWLLIQHHAGIDHLQTAPTLQKFEEAASNE